MHTTCTSGGVARIRSIPLVCRHRHGVRHDDGLAVEGRAERRPRSAEPRRRLPGEEPHARSAANELGRRRERLAVHEQHRRDAILVEEVRAVLRVASAELDDGRHRRRTVCRNVVGAERDPALLGRRQLQRRVLHLIERIERAHRVDLARSRLIVEGHDVAEAMRAALEQREHLVLRQRRVLLEQQRDDTSYNGRRHRRADGDPVRVVDLEAARVVAAQLAGRARGIREDATGDAGLGGAAQRGDDQRPGRSDLRLLEPGRGGTGAREPAQLALEEIAEAGDADRTRRSEAAGLVELRDAEADVRAGDARPARAVHRAAHADDGGMRRGEVDGPLAHAVGERGLAIAAEGRIAEALEIELGHAGALERDGIRPGRPLARPHDDRAARAVGDGAAIEAVPVDDAGVVVAGVPAVLMPFLNGRYPLTVGPVETDLEVGALA